MKSNYLKLLLNIYPPYWGTGIVVRHISPDFRRIDVQMKMHWYNRNYVKTHFGGSLYAMCDPFFMLMLMQILGKAFVVWDKAARIEFIQPGQGTVKARFLVSDEQIEDILQNTAEGQKYFAEFSVDITDETGQIIARVLKTLYIRKSVRSSFKTLPMT